MEKFLLISSDSTLEVRLGELLGSPRLLARISSWPEAHRVMTRSAPAAVVVAPDRLNPAEIRELVCLNNLLNKEGKKAFLLAPPGDLQIRPLADMFTAVSDVLPLPTNSGEWKRLRDALQPFLPPAKEISPAAAPLEFIIPVPPITQGTIPNFPVGRLLYLLSLQKSSGILHLRSGTLTRSFAFVNGHFAASPENDSAQTLTSVFAWPHGEFRFENRRSASQGLSPSLPLIQEGIAVHQPQRQIMDALMPKMASFPLRTTFWATRSSKTTWPVLSRFLSKCDGSSTLEAVLSSMGRDVTEAFRAALFAAATDLLLCRDERTAAPIEIKYQFQSASPSTPSRSSSTPGIETSASIPPAQVERELREKLKKFNSMSAHEIFGLWEGCGRETVKETFYRMVKEHHPDVYGGNVSPQIKSIAQNIFVKIRKAYAELMKIEDEQTTPAPTEAVTVQPRRQRLTTLRTGPVESTSSKSRPPTTSASGLAGETTESRLERIRAKRRASTPAPASDSPRAQRTTTSSRPRRTTSNASAGFSDASLGNDPSDPEWRRKKLERLERKSNRPRRPTPIAKGAESLHSPTDPAQVSFNRGYTLFKQDHFDEALEHFRKAYSLDGENGLYLTFYANSLFLTDPSQDREAVKLLRKAIESGQRQALPDAHLFLGNILKVQGKEDKAYQHFKTALELNPASRDAEREIRLYERRHSVEEKTAPTGVAAQAEGFFKKLFKK